MNAKIMTALFATFVMLFAGVAVADSADAVEVETVPVSYVVGDYTFQVNQDKTDIVLKDLESLGATAPEGKKFVKWTTEDKGKGTAYLAGSTYILPAMAVSVTLYACFEDITYTATFVAGDVETEVTGTLAQNKDLSRLAPADPTATGKIFVGWLAEGADAPVAKADLGHLTADITYTAVFKTDFKIMFVDGDKTNTMNVSNVVLPDKVTREGFTFLGWFIGTEQIEDPVEYADTVTADTTFTAKWEPVNCYVTFTAGDFSKTVPVLYGQTVGELALPDGYEAWQTKSVTVNADDTEAVTYADFDFDTPVKADMTLYGKETTIFSVKFVVDDNEFAMTSEKVVVPATDKVGFKFLGWAVDGEVIDLETFVIDADVVFTATFEPYTYTVTFMDGEKVVTTQTVKYGEKAIVPATAFIGWQTKSVKVVEGEDGETSEVVSFADYDFSAPVTEDVVLYGVTYVPEPTGMDDPVTKTVAILAGIVILILLAVLVSKIKKGEPVLGIKFEKAKKDKKEGEE